MVVALIALAMSMTGAGYAAAKITGKQIKNGSVSGTDIKNNSITGADVKESKLSKVPSAGTADSAASAARATSAASADTVGGQTISKVYFDAPKSTPAKTIFEGGGLKISADCNSIYDISLIATTSKSDSQIIAFVRGSNSVNATQETDLDDGTFDPGVDFNLLGNGANSTGDGTYIEFTYTAPDKTVATGTITAYEVDSTTGCKAYGHVTVG
jgi:hypothetical protein